MHTDSPDDFIFLTEQFADFNVGRCRVPGFEELSLQQKKLTYFLSQAGLAGRDIAWDQRYKHNLYIRRTLEAIVETYTGNRKAESFGYFMTYVKRVWMCNGIHHAYSSDKMQPGISEKYFEELVRGSSATKLPLQNGESVDDLITKCTRYLFDMTSDAKCVVLDSSVDVVAASAGNFYEGVTATEVEDFYAQVVDEDPLRPVSHGINSKLVKEDGHIRERVWKVDGMYGDAIKEIIDCLTKACDVAESDAQRESLQKLIEFYTTGDLKAFDAYSVLWAQDTKPVVDFINGFIEVYDDPMSKRGTYESCVSIRNPEATKRISAITENADWFEKNSPIGEAYKKPHCTGIAGSGIFVVSKAGHMAPLSNIGQNLPNADWIRKEYGSKSITLENILEVQDSSKRTSGILEEFAFSQEEVDLDHRYGLSSFILHVDMHEVIGHGSGQLKAGVATTDKTLKSYASTLEEARADLVALYYAYDQKLIDIGVMESLDAGKTEYNRFIRDALMSQLVKVAYGKDIEESHMRNRQLIAGWCYEKGKEDKVIEKKIKDEKTYFVVNDHQKLRMLFGQLLKEIQRIKSEGDYEAGKNLVETYGVKVDPTLHKEVLERYKKLDTAPFTGIINPKLFPVYEGEEIVDVTISYPTDFTAQMLEYARDHSFLPTYN